MLGERHVVPYLATPGLKALSHGKHLWLQGQVPILLPGTWAILAPFLAQMGPCKNLVASRQLTGSPSKILPGFLSLHTTDIKDQVASPPQTIFRVCVCARVVCVVLVDVCAHW